MQKNRSIHSLILAAALVAAATLSSCTNEDNAVVENPSDNEVLFTATLAPRGEAQDDGATRAVDSSGKTKWKNGELIHVYYEKEGGGYGTAEAEIVAVATDGSATFTATLTGAKDGGQVKLVYPKSIGDNGELKVGNLNYQAGTISDISKKYDAATATATLDVSNATFSSPVAMQNRVCICKFNFIGLHFGDDENWYKIDITVTDQGGTPMTYEISGVTQATISAVYVAMLPTENADVVFKVEGYHSDDSYSVAPGATPNIYTKSVSGVKLVAGNFYTNASIAFDMHITSTITVDAGVTLYLNNANIDVSDGPGILCKGDATIVLTGENTVKTTATYEAGIQAGPAGTTLTISGSGSLTATGADLAAGIGTSFGSTCGNINISGGTIIATGGSRAAAIGAGCNGNCGTIIISGTDTHIMATKGTDAPYSIGKGGSSSYCNIITIGTETYVDGIPDSPFYWQWPTTTP